MTAGALVVHNATQQQIERWMGSSHALLLIGPDGIGKGALAQYIAASTLHISFENVSTAPAVTIISPDEKGTISIEAVRELQHFLKLKTIGTESIRRIIIVEHAQGLTTEAQNAFLKLLEEPPSDTILILTADRQRAVLPTILSRIQVVTVMEPTKDQLMAAFSQYELKIVTQAYFLSGGLPGLMTALLLDDKQHPLLQSVVQAKVLLQQDLFARLTQVDQLSKQRHEAVQLCAALGRIAQTALEQAAVKGDTRRIAQWQRIIKAVHEAKDLLQANVNTKLTLTQLMLHLSS